MDQYGDDHPLKTLGRRPRPLTSCGTCGRKFAAAGGRTRDHIIPQGWVTAESLRDALTWYVCHQCNNYLGDCEDRLRSVFVGAASHHPGLADTVEAAARRSPARIGTISRGWALSATGIAIPADWVMPDLLDLKLVFRKMTRGLHWWENHELPPKWNVEARVLAPDHLHELTKVIDSRTIRIGHEVWWRRGELEDGEGQLWLFVLYGAVSVGVFCGDAAHLAPSPYPVAHVRGDTPTAR